MGRAARIAQTQGLGRPVRTYRQAFPLWFPALFVVMAVVIVGATELNPDLGIGVKAAGAAVPLVVLGVIWWVITDVRMVLCEGGILMGRFAPLLSPYAIPYRQIEPHGVTCVSDVGRCPPSPDAPTARASSTSRRPGAAWCSPGRRPRRHGAAEWLPRRSRAPAPERCGPSRTAGRRRS